MRAKKRFGQNFLHDPGVIARIVAAIAPTARQHLVEIGPGLGALTRPLLASGARMDVVELDRDLIRELEGLDGERLTVHCADALTFDFASLAVCGERLRLVGNLPYNISTPLLFHLLEQAAAIADMHFMLQLEVVERMAAAPGGSDYGRLSVMLQYRCAVQPLFRVGSGAFRPAPKVDSAVVRLIPHTAPPVQVGNAGSFARIVAQAFSQRRKTLRNTLRGLLDEAAIRAAGVDPGARPQTLSLESFAALSRVLAGAPAGANDVQSQS